MQCLSATLPLINTTPLSTVVHSTDQPSAQASFQRSYYQWSCFRSSSTVPRTTTRSLKPLPVPSQRLLPATRPAAALMLQWPILGSRDLPVLLHLCPAVASWPIATVAAAANWPHCSTLTRCSSCPRAEGRDINDYQFIFPFIFE